MPQRFPEKENQGKKVYISTENGRMLLKAGKFLEWDIAMVAQSSGLDANNICS